MMRASLWLRRSSWCRVLISLGRSRSVDSIHMLTSLPVNQWAPWGPLTIVFGLSWRSAAANATRRAKTVAQNLNGSQLPLDRFWEFG